MEKLYYINLSHYNFEQRTRVKQLLESRGEGILGILYNTDSNWWSENWKCSYSCFNLHYNKKDKVWYCLNDRELNSKKTSELETVQLDFKEFLEHYNYENTN